MSATITTEHGEFSGRTVASIVRREYGRDAEFRPSADPNEPRAGIVTRWLPKADAHAVLATVYRVEGETQSRDDDMSADEALSRVEGLAADLAVSERKLREGVREAVAAGATVASVAQAAGVTRQTVYRWLDQ